MTSKTLVIILFILGGLAASHKARAQQPQPVQRGTRLETTVSADFASKYVWRGQLLNDGAVLQPYLELALTDFLGGRVSVSWWGSMDADDIDDQENEFTEYDWTLSYRRTLMDRVELDLGLIAYYYPHDGHEHQDSDAMDVYAILALNLTDPRARLALKAFGAAYYEADDVSGWYGKGGMAAGMRLNDRWTLEALGWVGFGSRAYNEAFFGTRYLYWTDLDFATQVRVYNNSEREAAVTDATATVKLVGQVDNRTTVHFGVGYSAIVDKDLEKNADLIYSDSDNLWFFSGLTARF